MRGISRANLFASVMTKCAGARDTLRAPKSEDGTKLGLRFSGTLGELGNAEDIRENSLTTACKPSASRTLDNGATHGRTTDELTGVRAQTLAAIILADGDELESLADSVDAASARAIAN